ncbi:hypothetical protein RFI_34071 [Reticulomyxa filosa]|uniref:Uncharacterized protein n=1 Tax=Reticulomyxa filosa TaxID=46433 RepID=X6LNZ7_RETFI|nr:hypothetical protein RFI_34071 [Reticulomyxa filosa]|eukprot:ETO03339.1 hypothetical protein RFI_34071 [Reticulomyxa filosa]
MRIFSLIQSKFEEQLIDAVCTLLFTRVDKWNDFEKEISDLYKDVKNTKEEARAVIKISQNDEHMEMDLEIEKMLDTIRKELIGLKKQKNWNELIQIWSKFRRCILNINLLKFAKHVAGKSNVEIFKNWTELREDVVEALTNVMSIKQSSFCKEEVLFEMKN